MKSTISWKHVGLGALVAIILTVASFQVVTYRNNALDEFDHAPIAWEVDSPLSLSQQVYNHRKQLLSVTVSPGEVLEATEETAGVINRQTGEISNRDNTFSYQSTPVLNHNSSGMSVTYVSAKTELQYRLNPDMGYYHGEIESLQQLGDKEVTVEKHQLYPLHTAFSNDVGNFSTLVSITKVDINQLLGTLDAGDRYWKINHVYTDGTLMEFTIVKNIMILRFIQLEKFMCYENKGEINNISCTRGPVWLDKVYPTYVSNITGDFLPNYQTAINQFIGVMVA